MKKCDRCGGELRVRQMSKFNTDVLCPQCIEEEKQHPNYEKAAAAEREAVRRGDRDFPGIDWSGKDGRVRRARKNRRNCVGVLDFYLKGGYIV